MKGWRVYTTNDGVRVAMLHYSADPGKDPDTKNGSAWLRSQLKGYPGGIEGAKWQQEMEMNFHIRGGERVFADWESRIEPKVVYPSSNSELEIQDHWPIYCGLDWGVANRTVWTAHAFEGENKGYCFDEEVWKDVTIDSFMKRIQSKWYYHQIRGVIGDPSIWNRNQVRETHVTSVGEMLANEDLYVQKGRNEVGIDMTFVSLLRGHLWADLENPKWMISDHCRETINNFRNLRKHPNLGQKDYRDDPEKIIQKRIDAFDSCKYVLMSAGYDAPEGEDFMPNTFDWWLSKIEEEKRRISNLIR